MVETEKVCSNKISTASTTCDLVQRTKSLGDNRDEGGREVSEGAAWKKRHQKEDVASGLARSNSIATGNKTGAGKSSDGEVGKGHRPNLERTVSAYYVFSSLPQVVQNVRPKTGYRNNVSRPRGAHDYFNVMWDPHVYRGSTTTLSSSLKQPDSTADLSNHRDQEDRYRRRRAFLQGSQNTFNRSSQNNSLVPLGGAGGGNATTIRSNRYRMTTKVTSRSRTFPPPEGRHQVHVQTEEYLEDLSRDVIRGPEMDAIVQTDPIEDDELLSSPLANLSQDLSGRDAGKGRTLPVVAGVDASTQVLPGELVTFEERVQPVVESVVGRILEQSLLETMEEEEIGALKAQQNRFLEKRKQEERELERLQEQQKRISAEKERLKRHLEAQLKQRQLQQNSDTATSGEGEGDEAMFLNEATARGGANGISTAYLLELLPSVLNSLRQEGFLLDENSGDEAFSSYQPLWLQNITSTNGDDEGSPAVVYNGNNSETDENHLALPHMNDMELVAADNPMELSTEQPESLKSELSDGEKDDKENGKDERVDEVEACLEAGGTEGAVDAPENQEITPSNDTEEDDQSDKGLFPSSTVGVECAHSDLSRTSSQEVLKETGGGESALSSLGGESEANSFAEKEEIVESLYDEVNPTGGKEAEANNNNEISEDATGSVTDQPMISTQETSSSPSTSSSHKLPNGAIPNVL